MTTHDDLVSRLREQCNGHPHAKIAWPHRILHEAAIALEAKDAEIARLTTCLSNAEDQFQAKVGEVIALRDRITDLERQLAEEPTKAMVDAGVAFALNVTLSGEYRWSQYVADLFKTMRAAAIRGGAK